MSYKSERVFIFDSKYGDLRLGSSFKNDTM